MKGYSQMTPAERSTYLAEQLAELDQERGGIRTEMAARFSNEGVHAQESVAKVEAYFAAQNRTPRVNTNRRSISGAAIKPRGALERFVKLRETKVIVPVPNKNALACSASL